ncbi:hypothetical protein CKA32_003310 [Geitlerinema sp. FC II]|nr:hypothetical protein CKA32_003310 [Geitlerinema sp. FC II]
MATGRLLKKVWPVPRFAAARSIEEMVSIAIARFDRIVFRSPPADT